MEEAKNNEEISYPSNPFSSHDSIESTEFFVTGQENYGNQHHGEVEKDDDILFLMNDPDTLIGLDQGGFDASDDNSEIKLEDAKVDSPELDGILTPLSLDEPKELEMPKNENEASDSLKKDDDVNKMAIVDTAAPFESVRAAVTKFGGIVEGKTDENQNAERQKNLQLELKKVQEEGLKYQKQYEAAETDKEKVLQELDDSNRLLEELKHQVEKAETQEAEAKQDYELADLRLKEMDQGITDNASVATKAQLEVAKERHASAIAELKSVKHELEFIQREYTSLVHERDIAIRKATDAISASKEIEKAIEDLTLELMATRELLVSAHSAQLKAEDQRIGAALCLQIEKVIWEKELEQAEGELQQLNEQALLTNDVKSKLDRASALQVSLKAELASYSQEAIASTADELEEVRTNIEKANDNIECLRVAVSILKTELEREKTSLTTMTRRKHSGSVSISPLEAELNRINAQLEVVLTREKEAREKMVELPKAIQQASEEAEQAKLVADLAREELRKVKEEADQAKAGAGIVEMRIKAALEVMETAKASEKLAMSAIKALEESKKASMESRGSSNGVTLPLEEYYRLSKKANQAEELGNKRVISATEQVEAAKESETKNLRKLEEAVKTLEERKEELRGAVEMAEKAEEETLGIEKELHTLKAEQEHERKINGTRSLPDFSDLEPLEETESSVSEADATLSDESPSTDTSLYIPRSNTTTAVPEVKRRKRLFFARLVMFLARKKVQSLK